MSFHRLFSIAALSLTLVAGSVWIACNLTTSAEPEPQTKEEYSRQPSDGGETVTIKPQTPFVAKHTEVTVRLDIRKRERVDIEVDPETAIIFADPRDERLVEQVLWRVECWTEGELGSCPDLVREVVIRPKEGCSEDLFAPELPIDLTKATAIASGEPNLDVYAKQMEMYQSRFRALVEKDQTLTNSLLDCSGRPAGTAPEGIDPYYGLTWLYNVTVYLANEMQVRVDPEIWIEREED
jgi:hypothetical protein